MYRYRVKIIKVHTPNSVTLEIDLGFDIKKTQFAYLQNVRPIPGFWYEHSKKDYSKIREIVNSWIEEKSKDLEWPFIADVYKEDTNSPYAIELYAINDPVTLNEILMNEGWGDQ